MKVPCRYFPCIFVISWLLPMQVNTMLNCYHCKSDRSLEDCYTKQEIRIGCNISSGYSSHCYISQWTDNKTGQKEFGKQCIAAAMCNKKDMCPPQANHCEVYCCDQPLCNEKLSSSSRNTYATRTPIIILSSLVTVCLLFIACL